MLDGKVEYIKELMLQVKNDNDETAFDELVCEFSPLKYSLIFKYVGYLVDYDDLEQEIDIAIYNACVEYDESYDYPISFIEHRVKQAVLKFLRKVDRENRLIDPVSSGMDIEEYEDFLGENEYCVQDIDEKVLEGWTYEYLVHNLTDKQRVVVDLLFKGYTQEDIAEFMGISRQAVGKHLVLARKKIRDNYISLTLDDENG